MGLVDAERKLLKMILLSPPGPNFTCPHFFFYLSESCMINPDLLGVETLWFSESLKKKKKRKQEREEKREGGGRRRGRQKKGGGCRKERRK